MNAGAPSASWRRGDFRNARRQVGATHPVYFHGASALYFLPVKSTDETRTVRGVTIRKLKVVPSRLEKSLSGTSRFSPDSSRVMRCVYGGAPGA